MKRHLPKLLFKLFGKGHEQNVTWAMRFGKGQTWKCDRCDKSKNVHKKIKYCAINLKEIGTNMK